MYINHTNSTLPTLKLTFKPRPNQLESNGHLYFIIVHGLKHLRRRHPLELRCCSFFFYPRFWLHFLLFGRIVWPLVFWDLQSGGKLDLILSTMLGAGGEEIGGGICFGPKLGTG